MGNNNRLYIYMDESGLINENEPCAVYGGLWFISKKDKDDFNRKYKAIIKDIRCKYCHESIKLCNNNCPEVKHFNIKASDKRRINNLLKNHYGKYAIIIDNKKLFKRILESKQSRGRYKDFVIKLMIKEICKFEIQNNKIDDTKTLFLCFDVDQSSTASNGYYDLKEGIAEELVHGINNFDYNTFYPPILSDLNCTITYWDSSKHSLIQASDILVGKIRKDYLDRELLTIKKNITITHFRP